MPPILPRIPHILCAMGMVVMVGAQDSPPAPPVEPAKATPAPPPTDASQPAASPSPAQPLEPAKAPSSSDALPKDPVKPGESTEMTLLPDELPMLPAGGDPSDSTELIISEPSPRFKLQLALDAVKPVLPPLDEVIKKAPFADGISVFVKRFKFKGNKQFFDWQLERVIAKYKGTRMSSEDLEAARVALTKKYVDAGFITSGAVLPDQDLNDGTVIFELVEGRLAEIDLHGNFWFRSWWLRNQIRRAAGRPTNVNTLKTGLQLLRQNPGIRQVNAELTPGVRPGESFLHVTVKDQHPFRAGFEINNFRPPSVGEGVGELYFQDLNLTGHNDPLSVRWGLAEWTKEGAIDYSGGKNLDLGYEVPVTPWDTTLALHYNKGNSSIIDETFASLGISSQSEQYGAMLHQPLYQTLQNTVAIGFGADRKHAETQLLGRPFTLSLGAIDGESDVFALRGVLEWVNRSQRYVLALRSTFSFGLYEFGSTHYDPKSFVGTTSGVGGSRFDPEVPDSKFFSWLGQAQYVWRVFDPGTQSTEPPKGVKRLFRESTVVLRGNVQLADETLLPLEQFSLGGAQSVRGYRENQILRDSGGFVSAEMRIPVWLAADNSPVVSLAPFFDWGIGWNENKVDDQFRTLYSAGVGVLVKATQHAQVSVYWGHPFENFKNPRTSLQDDGWHISVSINAF